MMDARKIALTFGAVLALLVLAIPAASEPQAGIIVEGADAVIDAPVMPHQDLSDSIAGAGPRVVVEFSNDIRRMDLEAMQITPPIPVRVVVEYANAILRADLPAVPADLQTVLDQVSDRVVFQYANANLAYSLYYPRELINDTTPPVLSEPAIGPIGANGIVTFTWTTDEFADSTVLYDTMPGLPDPEVVSDPLPVKLHAVPVAGLVEGTTYYYRLQSTDLSGNTTTSPEFDFIPQPPPPQWLIYLPLVVRN
jgi:hypothetical protein